MQICFAIWLHLSTGRRACTHDKSGSKLDCYQLQWMASELAWPLDYHVWKAMLERYKSFQPKPENNDELKKVLQLIWDQLPQDSIKKAILLSVPKTSGLCESWWWTSQTYAKMNYLSDFGICNKSMFLENENYKLLLITPCRLENMA